MRNINLPLLIQSYWTKPLFTSKDTSCHRIDGGWGNPFVALCAYAYSALSISKYYPNTVLYTDDYGIKLFGDILSLPYAEIFTALNNIDIHPNLWALGKVYTYSLQTEPFIHIDNDIFLWDRLPKRVENALLCCQNKEIITSDYSKALGMMQKDFQTIPSIFCNNKFPYSINAGILGGRNIDFLNKYSKCVLDTYNIYRKDFERRGVESGYYNIILEQLSFAKLAQDNNERITYLIEGEDFNDMVNQVIDISTVPITTTYIHLLGNLKKYTSLAQFICNCLRFDYPDSYNRIVKYCHKGGIKIDLPNGNESYDTFCARYSSFIRINDINTFMSEIYFKLPNDASVFKNNDGVFVTYSSSKRSLKLSGWSLIIQFLTQPRTGKEVIELMHQIIGDKISLKDIESNVLSFLMRSLYGSGLIEIVYI